MEDDDNDDVCTCIYLDMHDRRLRKGAQLCLLARNFKESHHHHHYHNQPCCMAPYDSVLIPAAVLCMYVGILAKVRNCIYACDNQQQDETQKPKIE